MTNSPLIYAAFGPLIFSDQRPSADRRQRKSAVNQDTKSPLSITPPDRSSVFSEAEDGNALRTHDRYKLPPERPNYELRTGNQAQSILPDACAPTDPVSSKVFSAETTPGHPTDMLSNIS